MSADMLQGALWYASKGLPVFPCWPNQKNPITKNGFKDATTDEAAIRAWWTSTPDANVATPMGVKFVALDVDGNGMETLMGHDPIPHSPEVITPKGGSHIYLATPITPLTNTVRFAEGLDWRGEGSYILLPPSKTTDGPYKWKHRWKGDETLPEVPSWIVEAIRRLTSEEKAAKTIVAPGIAIPDGERNATLFSRACWLRRFAHTEAEIYHYLVGINARCTPRLEDAELRVIAGSATKYQPEREPDTIAPREEIEKARSGHIAEFRPTETKRGVPTGFMLIDDNTTTFGFPNGQMSVVAAYTGGGKTAFKLQCAYNAASEGYRVCYATFADMGGTDLHDRLVRNLSGWSGANPPDNYETKLKWERAVKSVEELSIHIHDVSEMRVDRDVESFADWYMDQRHRFDICFLDYAQELRSKEKGISGMFEHAEQACHVIRWLAATTNVPFVVGSQITEGSEKHGTRDITMGSRIWENRAGVMLKLRVLTDTEREADKNGYSSVVGLSAATIQKNRFGIKKVAPWKWDSTHVKFVELGDW